MRSCIHAVVIISLPRMAAVGKTFLKEYHLFSQIPIIFVYLPMSLFFGTVPHITVPFTRHLSIDSTWVWLIFVLALFYEPFVQLKYVRYILIFTC